MTINILENVPQTECSHKFLQGMADRMAVSYFKYGAVADAFPSRVRAIQLNDETKPGTLELRLQQYRDTGNTEFLMDVANYAMIEFMRPRHPEAHYKQTDSTGTPGRVWSGEVDPSQRGNTPDKWTK